MWWLFYFYMLVATVFAVTFAIDETRHPSDFPFWVPVLAAYTWPYWFTKWLIKGHF